MPTQPAPSLARPPSRGVFRLLWPILPAVMIGGWFYPLLGLAVPICFVGGLLIAPFAGRKWCGKLCPRGSFFDHVLRPVSASKRMPSWAKHPATRVAVVVVLMTVMMAQLVPVWGDWEAVGRVFVLLLTVTTVVGIAVGLFTHQRVWCAVCPAGTMASWMSRNRGAQVRAANDACVECAACRRECPMDLMPHEVARSGYGHRDCLKCEACAVRCPVEALEVTRMARRDQPGAKAA